MRVACLGLGRMGWHIAGHLADHSDAHDLAVFDVVDGLTGRWVEEHNGTEAASVESAVTDAQFIITSLPSDQELAEVAKHVLPAIAEEAIWIDHSTTSARIACELGSGISAVGGHFLDGPVSGGVDGARRVSSR
ncbi:MAG: hypothetical protein Ct9H300mP31_06440 [Acidimicrobiaceae bacterium]|nr:MAG: hypothetical protein Ct9H300mP31_06440 [Acidimicrobiaceae bacterium]